MGILSKSFPAYQDSNSDLFADDILCLEEDQLRAVPEHKRRKMVRTLFMLQRMRRSEINIAAAASLLRTKPYPRAVELHDQKVTARFHRLWLEDQNGAGGKIHDPIQLFKRNCHLAVKAMGLDIELKPTKISARSFSGSAKFDFYNSQKEIHGIAAFIAGSASLEKFSIWLNKDNGFWYRKPSDIDRLLIAEYALHEITHLEQRVMQQNKRTSHPYYADMNFYRKTIGDMAAYQTIYRQMPNERQPYYRQNCFKNVFRGANMEPEANSLGYDQTRLSLGFTPEVMKLFTDFLEEDAKHNGSETKPLGCVNFTAL